MTDPGDGMYPAHTTTVPDRLRRGGAFRPSSSSVDRRRLPIPYDNGRVFGSMDLLWREEQGDWRFYFFDVPDTIERRREPPGQHPLGQHTYRHRYTDLWDRPRMSSLAIRTAHFYHPDYYGPYTLEITGQSNDVQIDRSVWLFNTATGGPHEIVSAEARPGLERCVCCTTSSSPARISTKS